jgi:hypothetical protein
MIERRTKKIRVIRAIRGEKRVFCEFGVLVI